MPTVLIGTSEEGRGRHLALSHPSPADDGPMPYTLPPSRAAVVHEAPADADDFRPTREHPCPVMRERGVYVADWIYHGTPIVYSVNSRHEIEQWCHWYEGHDFDTIERSLWRHLDAVDPVGPRAMR